MFAPIKGSQYQCLQVSSLQLPTLKPFSQVMLLLPPETFCLVHIKIQGLVAALATWLDSDHFSSSDSSVFLYMVGQHKTEVPLHENMKVSLQFK